MQPDPITEAFLSARNDLDLVLMLSDKGPKFVLKRQTAACKRLNQNVYYDNGFASLVFGLLLKHAGKVLPVFNDLTSLFVQHGCQCALLGLRRRVTREHLLDEVLQLPPVKSLRSRLIAQCTQHGEWVVVGHDATYKSLFSIIGQDKMAQVPDEDHAVHSFLGKSGALAGLSVQHTEGAACFKRASCEVLPPEARATTQWIFSDSPESVEGCYDVFPNLKAVAEDIVHG